MTNNVHILHSDKAPVRRRARPAPNVPPADVRGIAGHLVQELEETPEQKLRRYNEAINKISYHVCEAVKAIGSLKDISR